ncbi:hypothetical protein [Cohaesibacter intestini]|uniref:hypothetical protein n=1 Tax=Cohaesibacter intestini TaxID=2211145 RepID=UPI000DE9DA04|nr:hypothetical protein [Cohaesibacter intestini]
MSRIPQKIALAICSRGRSTMLERCQKSVANLNLLDGVQLSLVICDNNETAYDCETQSQLLSFLPAAMHTETVHQPQPSIPFGLLRLMAKPEADLKLLTKATKDVSFAAGRMCGFRPNGSSYYKEIQES